MFSGFFEKSSEEYIKAYEYLNNHTIEDIKKNIFLKFEHYTPKEKVKQSKNNPAVSIYSGYNNKDVAAVLYVNTPEGPIKIGAVPDVRRFSVNGSPFNVDNNDHVAAINPSFVQIEQGKLILTGLGKDFKELYKTMMLAYPSLDGYANQVNESNSVTVDNKTVNEIFDFNQSFNITQNLTRESLSDLGAYADFEVKKDVIENGEIVEKTLKGKLVRESGIGYLNYYLITPEGIEDVTSDLGDLKDTLESLVQDSFESGYMTFYKHVSTKKGLVDSLTSESSYVAVGLSYPHQENTPEVNKKFGENFKVLVNDYLEAQKKVKTELETDGTELNDLKKRLNDAKSEGTDSEEYKEISRTLRKVKNDYIKGLGVTNIGKKWFFAVNKKEGTIEYPIQVQPSLSITPEANEVQFLFTVKSFYDASNNKVKLQQKDKNGKLSDMTL